MSNLLVYYIMCFSQDMQIKVLVKNKLRIHYYSFKELYQIYFLFQQKIFCLMSDTKFYVF